MSIIKDQLQRLLATGAQAQQAPEVAMQLKTVLEQLCEQMDTERQAKMAENKEDPLAAMLTQLAGALNGGPTQQGPSYNLQSVQQRQAAAVAAANNQQQVQALLHHQMELLAEKRKSQQQQLDVSSSSMPGSQQHLSQLQQLQLQPGQQQQHEQYDSQQYHCYDLQLKMQQQHNHHHLNQQQVTSGAAIQFNIAPSPALAPPVHQQEQQQKQPEEVQPEQPPPKRRRGRPASSATKVHPNLVYVRRFRERQKQMEMGLEATVKAKQQELQRLQEEQQQLCVKWEALEQVLKVQNDVLRLMQQLHVSSPTAVAAVADKRQEHHGAAPVQQQPAAQQQADSLAPPAADVLPVQPGASKPASGDSELPFDRQSCASPVQEQPAAPAGGMSGAVQGTDRQCTGSSDSDSALETAVAEAAAVLHEAVPPMHPSQDQAHLLQQARQWLEPVKMYAMRAALMLEQLGMLPANQAAERALAAAKACPAAAAPAAAASRAPANSQATASAITAAIAAAVKEQQLDAASKAAAVAAVAVRSAWDGAAVSDVTSTSMRSPTDTLIDGVPVVQYPYSIGMYVITPDAVKNVCWPLNMETWHVDNGNNQAHAEAASRAMWAVLTPERWRLLRATWLTMSSQLQQVQQELMHLHALLRTIGNRPQNTRRSSRPTSTTHRGQAATAGQQQQHDPMQSAECSSSDAASNCAAAGALFTQQQQQQQPSAHGQCLDGFESLEDSSAYEYAAAAVQVESVLLREDAISFQLCGAFLDLLDPLEIAVGYVSSWPYHPQAFTMFDVMFKLGEPPEAIPGIPAVS